MVSPSRSTGPALPSGPFSDRVGRLWAVCLEREKPFPLFLISSNIWHFTGEEERQGRREI